jgi:Protein of unknown function (DUF982)
VAEAGGVGDVAGAGRDACTAALVAVPAQRMSTTQPFAGVTIETTVVGRLRTITSVREAAECLVGDWPTQGRGGHYRRAVRACHAALEGTATAESAQRAFIRAAIEVGILVRTAGRF